jgi:myo-inositol 2-dehydrogenase/D-chiro-inositol 1-dehydrogenase
MLVGLVGAGRIGAVHARNVIRHARVTNLLVYDPVTEAAQRLVDDAGGELVDSVDALLERGIEALVIAAPTPFHAELILKAVDAGIAAFCEKPIALDLKTTDMVVDRVRSAGTLVHMGFQRRFDPPHRAARSALARGDLGQLHLIRTAGLDHQPPPETYVEVSGGIFADLHIHDFDAIRWLTGRDVREVYADGTVVHNQRFARNDDVDTSAVVLHMDDGSMALLSGARTNAIGYDHRFELHGSKDSVSVGQDERSPIHPIGEPHPAQPYPDFIARFAEAYRIEMEAFIDLVLDGGDSPCTVEDARAALAIAMAANRSRAERRPVELTEVG